MPIHLPNKLTNQQLTRRTIQRLGPSILKTTNPVSNQIAANKRYKAEQRAIQKQMRDATLPPE
jgi:hypothetical protein